MTHPLKVWLRTQTPRKTLKSFAREIGCHDITLRRMMKGDQSTSRDVFEKVERGTDGELKAITLYRLHQERRRETGALEAAE